MQSTPSPNPSAYRWCLLLVVLLGIAMNAPFFAYDTREQDVYYTWLEGKRLLDGENPYARVLAGDMRVNDKYATYFPGFYLLAAATQALSLHDFDRWILFWRPVFLVCNLAIAIVLLQRFARRDRLLLGLFVALFWLLNRWTLYTSRVAHIEFLPILLLLWSLLCFRTRRRTSLLLFGLSLAIKQLAIFLVPLYLLWVWREGGPDRLRRCMLAAWWIAVIPLLLSLPFLYWNAEGYLKSLAFSATRAPEGHIQGLHSLDALIGMKLPGFVGIPAKLPMLFVMAVLWWATAKRQVDELVGALCAFLVFLGFNSVLFMQYFCWVLALLPLALGERGRDLQQGGEQAA